ncbi:hypothetical protein CBS101457_003940 [Exobasidium rhododendri]|nr:hypothetical protein CBS101457_003940 [Exobasidium rhododendri]
MQGPFGAAFVVQSALFIVAYFALLCSADAQFPSIDFEGLGSVGVSGNFDGVSLYQPESVSNSFDSTTSSLLLRDSSGALTKINETNAGGQIRTICQRSSAPRTVYVGGLFNQIAGMNASNVAAYDPTSKNWTTLNGGLDGPVNALYCDDTHELVYVGGSFVRPSNVSNVTDTSRYLGGVASWNITGNQWVPAPFGGVNGSVSDIVVGVNSSVLRFTGAFDVGFASLPAGAANSGTNTSASALSAAWAPLPLGQSEFQGGPASNSTDFNDPAQILCPQGLDGANNTFLFADNTTGRLTMRAFRDLPVKGVRLANTYVDGRGTDQFSVISIPDNTELELLYLDPVTLKNVTCTYNCPLFHNDTIPYQDFIITDNPANGLVNGVKQMTGLQITVSTWFGAGAGFHLMQLLSDGGWAFAYDGYNRAQCNSTVPGTRNVASNSTNVGAWYQSSVTTSIAGTIAPVLALTDDFSNLADNLDAEVVWNVDVNYDGNYSVYLNVPGCTASSQCGQRTDVQARVLSNTTTQATPGNWTRVPQNNTLDAQVLIYQGPIQKTSANFTTSVQLTIPADAPAPTTGDRFTVLANAVSMQIYNSNETYQSYQAQGYGLLEYDVYDVELNNNSLSYGANTILANTSIIAVLANDTNTAFANATVRALNATMSGSLLNMTAGITNGTTINGTVIANGTIVNGTVIIQQSQQAYINQLVADLYSATQVLPNSTMTPFDFFAATLLAAGVRRNESEYTNPSAVVANQTYVGGNFTSDNFNASSGFANLVSFDVASGGKSFTRLAGGGLNGEVTSLQVVGTYLFVGGNFTATADNATGLNFVARYDTVANAWNNLAGGTDGAVHSLSILGTSLLVTGDFEQVDGANQTGGFAVWDTTSRQWVPQTQLVVGKISASNSVDDTTYLAGQVESVGGTVTSAAIGLSAPVVVGDYPVIDVLNFQFPSTTAASKAVPIDSSEAPNARRSIQSREHFSSTSTSLEERERKRSKFNTPLLSRLASRASSVLTARSEGDPAPLTSLQKRADAMDPASLASDGDQEILASAFWKRSDGTYLTIFGGNFTTSAGIVNLAIYDPTTTQLDAFPTLPPSSTLTVIRSIYVDGSTMYAGGDGGIVVFDLQKAKWNNIPPLSAASGTVLSVTAISHRPDSNSIIVAGTFTTAGGLPCQSVCQWDSKLTRWINLGNGIDGQVAAIDFAGAKADILVVAGSITLNGLESSLAAWSFDVAKGGSWTSYGSVGSGTGQAPGPATAVSVDNLNANAVYLAGRSVEGTYPYLTKWDGINYNDLGGMELLDATGIAQLTFVGLTQDHQENAIMESNRMLVVSGALSMRTYGNVSTALFDGQDWTPFLTSTRPGGGPGIIRAFTRSVEVLKFGNIHYLAIGIVILISIAIGLGVVFLLVLLGLIWALLFRKKNRSGVDVPVSPSDETLAVAGAAGEKKRPSSLLATLNAATENVMNDHHNYAPEAGVAAGVAGIGIASTSHGHGTSYDHGGAAAESSSHGHARQDSAALGGTLENSDETGQGAQSSQYHSDNQTGRSGISNYYSGDEGHGAAVTGAGTAAAAAAGMGRAIGGEDGEEEVLDGIEAHARYTFEATHPSELGVHAGEKISILDDQDEHWWLARNQAGQTGVLPSSYVL